MDANTRPSLPLPYVLMSCSFCLPNFTSLSVTNSIGKSMERKFFSLHNLLGINLADANGQRDISHASATTKWLSVNCVFTLAATDHWDTGTSGGPVFHSCLHVNWDTNSQVSRVQANFSRGKGKRTTSHSLATDASVSCSVLIIYLSQIKSSSSHTRGPKGERGEGSIFEKSLLSHRTKGTGN